jgi:hypothetical protein
LKRRDLHGRCWVFFFFSFLVKQSQF